MQVQRLTADSPTEIDELIGPVTAPSLSLESLADRPQWVVWRGCDGRKVPFNPSSPRHGARSNDRTTWGTRDAANRALAAMEPGDGKRGVGIMLGKIEGTDSLRLGGVDLDSCIDGSGDVAPWAAEVVARLDSYAEVSPGGQGIKVFFAYRATDEARLSAAMEGKHRQSWSRGSHQEIGLDVSNRYYAVTERPWQDSRRDLRPVALDDLLWIIRDAGPRYKAGAAAKGDIRDNSRSGRAFALAGKVRREGGDRDAFVAALNQDPELAIWAKDARQVTRAWNNSAPKWEDELDDFDALSVAPSRLRKLSMADCRAAPSRGYVVKRMIAPRDFGMIYGAPGAGKSLIAPHIGYAVATGAPVFGMRTRQGSVLYVAAEDPTGMLQRVHAIGDRRGDADNLFVVDGVGDLLSPQSADLAALREMIATDQPALVIVDTLAIAFPGLEENSAEDMGKVVAVARSLTEHGAAVVLIHHDTKAGTPTPRGHSLLNGALDFALQLQPRDEAGIIRGRLSKNRNGPCDTDIAFRIDVQDLGTDEDGDPITVALVAELASGSVAQGPKLTKSERAALAVLDSLAAGGDVTEDAWRAACIDGHAVSSADDRDNRRRAVKRAFEGLARSGVVTVAGGMARRCYASNGFDVDELDDLT